MESENAHDATGLANGLVVVVEVEAVQIVMDMGMFSVTDVVAMEL